MAVLWIVIAVVVVLGALGVLVPAFVRRQRAGAPPEPLSAPEPEPPVAVEPPPAEAPVVVEPPPAEPSPADLRQRLGKTRGLFAALRAGRERRAIEAATWDALEEALLRADVGVATTDALLEDLRRRATSGELTGGAGLLDALRDDLVALLDPEDAPAPSRDLAFDAAEGVVNVWLFVGVNGVGKTTTIGKLARHQVDSGRSVLLAAGDTFRAAAGEQLDLWAQRTGVEIVRGAEGADPSSVVFDAVQRAAARGNRLVLADTAGRLHTKVNLVEELKKIRRVADRAPGRVSEVLLVIDATTGQNGLVQARQFTEAVGVTGVVLTKLDGTAKGGVVIAVQRELGLPVKLVGVGEGADDLVPFRADDFVDALLGG
ncbi:MAG: signal recognition particle-docking protein FtsY [Actinomycetota bacterium]|jgi:fused signal recognition particle receptor|nr:signal recognition particle-docking protein FtsY [Actinomycetota bacterium]